MRVFHLLSNPGIGGIEGMLAKLIPRMQGPDCDLRIINLRSESQAYRLWERAGIPVIPLPTPRGTYLAATRALAQVLNRAKPDLVEIYGLRANFIGRMAARMARTPVVITGVLSTDDWRQRHHVALDRWTSPWVAGWIANSQACKQSLLNRERFPEDKIAVIYDGIDVREWTLDEAHRARRSEYRQTFGFQDRDLVCVTVANLREEKGVQYLVEAAPTVLAECPFARFLIIGSDWMSGRLQRRCQELGVAPAFTFAGYRQDIRSWYAAGDIAVLPSLSEGLPLCLIEAMSMGLPVIATRVSGIPELVDHPHTGILVAPRDPAALSEAIIALAKARPQRAGMGMLGRKRVERMFTIERMIEELLACYQRMLHRHKHGRTSAE